MQLFKKLFYVEKFDICHFENKIISAAQLQSRLFYH